jgi:hypothetical protein
VIIILIKDYDQEICINFCRLHEFTQKNLISPNKLKSIILFDGNLVKIHDISLIIDKDGLMTHEIKI